MYLPEGNFFFNYQYCLEGKYSNLNRKLSDKSNGAIYKIELNLCGTCCEFSPEGKFDIVQNLDTHPDDQ